MKRQIALRRLELACCILGVTALLFVCLSWARSAHAQLRGAAEFHELLRAPQPAIPIPPKEGAVFGQIDIERLGISTIVFEGVQPGTLEKGVGHIAGTGSAPHRNLVLAAHRDTFFRPLKDVRRGDRIEVITVDGSAVYEVRSWEVVEPSAVEVLLSKDASELTLLTCYPFSFVGSAPHRFVVHAVATSN